MDSACSLKEMWDNGAMTKGWIPCLDLQGNQIDKKPIIFCSMRCKKVDQCGSYMAYYDATDLLEEEIDKQANPSLLPGYNSFIKVISDKIGEKNTTPDEAEQPEENDDSEDKNEDPKEENENKEKDPEDKESENKEGENKENTEKEEEQVEPRSEEKGDLEDTKKKGKKKTAKKKRKRKARKQPDKEEEEEKLPTSPHVDIQDAEKYAILPLHVEDVEARGFVTKAQLNELLAKFKEEGIECSVFKLGKDINKKSKFDYLVVPLDRDIPRMVSKEDLQENIEEFTENNIQIRIFQLGKELRARKQIVIEEI